MTRADCHTDIPMSRSTSCFPPSRPRRNLTMSRIGNRRIRLHSEGADLRTAGDDKQFGMMPFPDQLVLWTLLGASADRASNE